MSDERHELKYIDISLLRANDWNPQKQDEAIFNRLVDEIIETGFIDPIEVVPLDDGTFRILGGEHRWKAAQVAGEVEVPVIILASSRFKDEDIQKLVTVRLNAIRGRVDPDKFLRLYKELVVKYGEESMQKLMGYTSSRGFQKLVNGVTRGMRKSIPEEMHPELEQAAKEARSVEDLSKIVQMLFVKHGNTINQGYMVFTHGSQEHIYIAMTPKMRKSMDKVLRYCRVTGEDINEFMEPLVRAFVKTAEAGLGEREVKQAPPISSDLPDSSDNPFN